MGNQLYSQTLTNQPFTLRFCFPLSQTHLAQHPAFDSGALAMLKEKHGKRSK